MPGSFLVAAAAFVIRDDGCVLFLRRSSRADHAAGECDTPNGRLETGETVLAALHREVMEETGLKVTPIRPVDTWRIFRGAQREEMIGITYLCRCTDRAEVLLSKEHDAYQWVRPDDVREFPVAAVFKNALLRVLDEIGARNGLTRYSGSRMAVLDDIAAERQRVTERLARVDAERERLAQQLAELDAAERVLSRMTPGGARRGRRGRAAEAAAVAPTGPSRQSRQTQPAKAPEVAPARRQGAVRGRRRAPQKPAVALRDAVLQAVGALGNSVSAEQIREYLDRELGMQVRPNHLGMALQRHRRAGRLQEVDGRWSTTAPTAG